MVTQLLFTTVVKKKTEDVIACHPEKNFVPSYDVESFVNSIEKPRRIMLMVQAGPGTDASYPSPSSTPYKGDILIDGWKHFSTKIQIRRNEELANSGNQLYTVLGFLVVKKVL